MSSQNPTSAVKPIDNVLAVVHQLTEDEKTRKSVTFDEVLTTMSLVHGDKEIADSNRGSCCAFGMSVLPDKAKYGSLHSDSKV